MSECCDFSCSLHLPVDTIQILIIDQPIHETNRIFPQKKKNVGSKISRVERCADGSGREAHGTGRFEAAARDVI